MSLPLETLAVSVLEDAGFAIVITDMTQPDYPIIFGNAAFEALTGYTRDEFIGKNPRFLQGDDVDQPESAILGKAIKLGKPVRTTLRNYRKDGSLFLNEVYISPIHAEQGKVTNYMGIQYDVTKATADNIAAQKAQDEAASLGIVLEASINEIFMFDVKTLKFVQANLGAQRNIGYSMDELREMTPLSVDQKFTQEQFETLISPLNTGEVEKINYTTVHQRKNGSLYPVDVHLQRSMLGDQAIFLAVILDITNRTETQAALDQAQRFLQSAPDATIIVNEAGDIQYSSEQTESLLGYSTEELLTMNVDMLVPDSMRQAHESHRSGFQSQPKTRLMGDGEPLFALSKEGRNIPVEVSLNPIQTADGLLISAALRDITERLKSEQTIREARDTAQAATSAKSRFLAAASHDLRQPLQSLSLYLSTLDRLITDPKALEVAGKMNMSLSSMRDLLDTLLDISKLESGSIEPNKHAFNAQSLLNSVVVDLAPIAAEKGLTLITEPSDYLIHSDLALLMRIVENFTSNAIRYTDSGTVTLSSKVIGNSLKISVTDTGIGIPQDVIENVFDEYYQLGNAHREQGKGLGLGLAVVKHIAALLGHEISVESVKGQGSTFSISVPLTQEADILDIDLAVKETKSVQGDLPTILCIDDNEAVLDSLTMLLDVIGYDLFQAGDGIEALAHIENGLRPNIILSDYRLPGDNGIEVIGKIRAQLGDDLPAIMMTGDTSGEKIHQSGLGNLEVLHKPVDVQKLIAFIDSMTCG